MYQKIIVPLDGSELAESVLPHVESIAKGCQAKDVLFVRVMEPIERPVGGPFEFGGEHPAMEPTLAERERDRFERLDEKREMGEEARESAAENYLKKIINQLNCPGVNLQAKVVVGRKVAESIAEYATASRADLIIMATHGRSGISRWAWGSVADKILRSACVPVLMVRPPTCVPS